MIRKLVAAYFVKLSIARNRVQFYDFAGNTAEFSEKLSLTQPTKVERAISACIELIWPFLATVNQSERSPAPPDDLTRTLTSANPDLDRKLPPAGQEKFLLEVGVPVTTRTTVPPKFDEREMAPFLERAKALAPKYKTELLKEA